MEDNNNKSASDNSKPINFSSTALDKFRSGDLWKKKEIVSSIGSNLNMEGGKLRIQSDKPLSYVESISSTIQELEEESIRFEPMQVYIKKGTNSNLYASSPLMLRG